MIGDDLAAPVLVSATLWVLALPPAALAAALLGTPPPRRAGSLAANAGRRLVTYYKSLPIVLLLGYAGGFLFGFALLSFGDVIGRSGNTGDEYVGHFNAGFNAFAAAVYGCFIGGITYPAGHFVWLRRIPGERRRTALVYASIGTLMGGLLGAVGGPTTAALAGCVGFLYGCSIARLRLA